MLLTSSKRENCLGKRHVKATRTGFDGSAEKRAGKRSIIYYLLRLRLFRTSFELRVFLLFRVTVPLARVHVCFHKGKTDSPSPRPSTSTRQLNYCGTFKALDCSAELKSNFLRACIPFTTYILSHHGKKSQTVKQNEHDRTNQHNQDTNFLLPTAN